jgi:hypothetical protein
MVGQQNQTAVEKVADGIDNVLFLKNSLKKGHNVFVVPFFLIQ